MNQSIIFQQVDTNMNIINNNPYRILGVYANSRKQEILANKGKATAFLKVGKPVEFPIDLNAFLPPKSRSVAMLDEAEAHLALAKEQLKYAQFWFLKMTPIDDAAFTYLFAGNIDEAITIWSKHNNLSSLQNCMICCLVKNGLPVALAEQIYEQYGSQYTEMVCPSTTLKMDSIDLIHQFIDTIGAEIGMTNLATTLIKYSKHDEWRKYASTQAVTPLINKILEEVDKTKMVDNRGMKSPISAARKLYTNTKNSLSQLKEILGVYNPQFAMISDKIGLKILQCGIDYFIDSKNSDYNDVAYTAMEVLRYSKSIVIGTLAKQRCNDQINELQKYIDNLPPKEVAKEDKAIKAASEYIIKLPKSISSAVSLLNVVRPYLHTIKQKLGHNSEYYLKMSTQIVRLASYFVVEEVNSVQKSDNYSGFPIEMPIERLTSEQRIRLMNRIKSTLLEAWKAITIMDVFDMEPQFRQQFIQNRRTLKSMCVELGVVLT